MVRIEGHQFDEFREKLNLVMTRALRDMIESGAESSTVTAKIKIGIERRAVPLTATESRIAEIPGFKFKVTSQKQVKMEMEGEVYEDQMELSIDETGELIYKKIPTGQMSMFDDDEEGT